MTELDPYADDEWDALIQIATYTSLDKAQEHALVTLAMNIPCWISQELETKHFTLHVETEQKEKVIAELKAYESEQPAATKSPQPETKAFQYGPGWILYTLWAATLIILHQLKTQNPNIVDLGASYNQAIIIDHEWWRPFTALFLHADIPHLLGNLLSGMFFANLVSRSIGPIRAWLMILLCGTLGNTLTTLMTWPEPFSSIGASTAVFGALGLLSGIGFTDVLRDNAKLPWARIAAPIIGGLVLLAWLGSGSPGDNTDVLGHLFGFLSGLLLGALFAYLDGGRTKPVDD